MAVVTALQFNHSSGAMICDEEYWFLRRRRSFFLDNLRNLVPEDISDALGIELVYGGYGHPGFHDEVIHRFRDEIRKEFETSPSDRNFTLTDIESLALMVRKIIQETRQRRVNDMLKFLYGFNIHDLNRGYFEEDGTKFEIVQNSIKSEAKRILKYEKKGGLTDPIFKNKAVLIGYDPEFGFRSFHLNAENTVCSLVSGGFESVGAGLYGAGIEFSRIMNRLTLDQRRNGFERVWGIIALYEATLNAYDHFHEVGGGLNLVYINGEGKTHAERYLEISDAPSQLAMEIVKACKFRLVTYEQIYPLIDALIFEGKDRKSVEKEFFAACDDTQTLRKLLRGYKLHPFPQSPTPKANRENKKTRKGAGNK